MWRANAAIGTAGSARPGKFQRYRQMVTRPNRLSSWFRWTPAARPQLLPAAAARPHSGQHTVALHQGVIGRPRQMKPDEP